MPPSMILLQDEVQSCPIAAIVVFLQFEDRKMRLAYLRMNSPGRLLLPVSRVRNGPALLVEVSRRILQRQWLRVGVVARRCQDLEFAQMKIPVVLSARSF